MMKRPRWSLIETFPMLPYIAGASAPQCGVQNGPPLPTKQPTTPDRLFLTTAL